MNMRILNTIGPVFTAEAQEILNTLGDVDYKILSQAELAQCIGQYDAALIGLGLRFDKDILNNAEKLKTIATATTGLDHIDIDTATKKGIQIVSLRGEHDFLRTITGTAELAFGLMLDLMRGISPAFDSVKHYQWDREQFRGHSVAGKTLGIVGLGRLGGLMATMGQGFGMHVIACDPHVHDMGGGVALVDFETLLKKSDIISIHIHLTDETKNMFHAAVFEKMKPSAYLINTARGQIVNEADLLEALNTNRIAGYATDVLSDETSFDAHWNDHPLVEYAKSHTNLIIVPHIGGMTHESRAATDIFIAKKLVGHLG